MATAVENAPPPVVEPAKAPAAVTPPANPPAAPVATPPAADAKTAPAAVTPAKADAAPGSLLADAPKAETPPADTKPAEKPGEAPTEWKLELPKDSDLSADHLKSVEEFAKPLGLTAAQAQKLVERDASAKAAMVAAGKAEYAKQYDTWAAQSKTEFGAKLPEVLDSAKRFLRTYDTTGELSAMLKGTPYGNFAPLMRVLAAAGNVLREDAPAAGNTNVTKPVDPVKAFYGEDHRKPSTAR